MSRDREGRDRRGSDAPDSGARRRRADIAARQEEFRLFRDKVILAVGTAGVTGISIMSTVVGVKDSAVTLSALAVFAGALGVPTALRWDERRRDSGDGT